jgi:hypothetical protein
VVGLGTLLRATSSRFGWCCDAHGASSRQLSIIQLMRGAIPCGATTFMDVDGIALAPRYGLTADFGVVDPHRTMRTYGPAERFTQPLVHAWRVWVNINAIRCK